MAGACFALGLAASGCGNGASIGETCTDSAECQSHLQCLGGVCTPRCDLHADCGDGYLCEAGECQQVFSEIGDLCDRELDCGPGQTCSLDDTDDDGDGMLGASCRADQIGAPTGAACTTESDCRNGTCSLGRCTEVCAANSDCPPELACVEMPRLLDGSAPMFRGCLQARGTLELDIPVGQTFQEIRVPVPGNARSFALVTRVDDPAQFAGAASVYDPADRELYLAPNSPAEFYDNPLRYAPAPGISTLLVPNTPAIEIVPGAYTIEVGSFTKDGTANGSAVPEVTVVYKLDDAVGLHLNFYFLDLEDHPCPAASGLDAAAAEASSLFQNVYLRSGIEQILGDAGINIDRVTYIDVPDKQQYDGLNLEDLPRLLRTTATTGGINIFFVRSIHPVGIQALVGRSPGSPTIPGTAASGIAVAADTLCYRDWSELARLTAHEIGRYMGLFRNREPDGAKDPILDSDESPANLMFYSEFGGTVLSPGQAAVLRKWPGLQ